MSILSQYELQRVRYWQGQALRSRDFNDQLAIEAQRRWWHNRALHNAYGVGFGLMTSVERDEHGAVTKIRVDCGLAYDCFGRELMLQRPGEMLVPKVPPQEGNAATLLIRHKDTAHFPKRNEMAAGCLTADLSPWREQPELMWKPSHTVEAQDGVPLARVGYETAEHLENLPQGTVFPDHLKNKIRYESRKKALIFKGTMSVQEKNELLTLIPDRLFQNAIRKIYLNSQKVPFEDPEFAPALSRPLARPRIASGATIPGNTPWKLWTIQGTKAESILGFEVEIDTAAAGFTQVPCYFAWLQGPLWTQLRGVFFPAFFAHIDATSINNFTFRLWMPALNIRSPRAEKTNLNFDTEFLTFAQRQKLFVCWLGIQSDLIQDEKVCK